MQSIEYLNDNIGTKGIELALSVLPNSTIKALNKAMDRHTRLRSPYAQTEPCIMEPSYAWNKARTYAKAAFHEYGFQVPYCLYTSEGATLIKYYYGEYNFCDERFRYVMRQNSTSPKSKAYIGMVTIVMVCAAFRYEINKQISKQINIKSVV